MTRMLKCIKCSEEDTSVKEGDNLKETYHADPYACACLQFYNKVYLRER